MAWDFSTDPGFQAQLDWMADFVCTEVWPLEPIVDELGEEGFARAIASLQEKSRPAGCGPRISIRSSAARASGRSSSA
jgi:acyl-CoA dehydrogenase